MMTIACLLAGAAFLGTIIHLYNGKPPLAVSVLLLAIALLLSCIPLR